MFYLSKKFIYILKMNFFEFIALIVDIFILCQFFGPLSVPIIIIAGIAYKTKPTEANFIEIGKKKISEQTNLHVIKLISKILLDNAYNMNCLNYHDYLFFATMKIKSNGNKEIVFIGLFNSWILCWEI